MRLSVALVQLEATDERSSAFDLLRPELPEFYRSLALACAQIPMVPANFTERTGCDHWEVLLRARAIEDGA